VLADGPFDYWESGMDVPMGEDLYDSFVHYQRRIIQELDGLSREYGFETLDATRKLGRISDELCERVTEVLRRRKVVGDPA
jgi:dTMP kinase